MRGSFGSFSLFVSANDYFTLRINALRDITLGIMPDIGCVKEYYFMEHIQIDGAECSRTYYFQLESGYMIFLLTKFMESKKRTPHQIVLEKIVTIEGVIYAETL